MINVIRMPCLQAAERLGSQRAATINESLINARHFSDMAVRRCKITIGQLEAHLC